MFEILTKMHGFATWGLYSPSGATWGMFYYGCVHFIWFGLLKKTSTHNNDNAWNSQDNFYYNSDWIKSERKTLSTPRMPRGWVNYPIIVKNPVYELPFTHHQRSPAHHMDSCTTLLFHVPPGLQFPSSIALMTHTNTAESTDYTADSYHTPSLSHGLPHSDGWVL